MRQQKYLQRICFPPLRVPAYQYFFRNGTIYNSQSLLCCMQSMFEQSKMLFKDLMGCLQTAVSRSHPGAEMRPSRVSGYHRIIAVRKRNSPKQIRTYCINNPVFNAVIFLEWKDLKIHKLLWAAVIPSVFSATRDNWKWKNTENESHGI